MFWTWTINDRKKWYWVQIYKCSATEHWVNFEIWMLISLLCDLGFFFNYFDVANTNDHSQEDLAIHESRKFKKILITYIEPVLEIWWFLFFKNQNWVNWDHFFTTKTKHYMCENHGFQVEKTKKIANRKKTLVHHAIKRLP